MLTRLLQIVFVPRSTRRKLATRRGGPAVGRKQVLDDAMTVYRRQLQVYESLDEETRRQIDADAAKLLGDAIETGG